MKSLAFLNSCARAHTTAHTKLCAVLPAALLFSGEPRAGSRICWSILQPHDGASGLAPRRRGGASARSVLRASSNYVRPDEALTDTMKRCQHLHAGIAAVVVIVAPPVSCCTELNR
jgi:hypothetical protein